jgi:hypothetical protein
MPASSVIVGGSKRANPHVAFLQLRQKLGAEPRASRR